jgi:hypothetical protein
MVFPDDRIPYSAGLFKTGTEPAGNSEFKNYKTELPQKNEPPRGKLEPKVNQYFFEFGNRTGEYKNSWTLNPGCPWLNFEWPLKSLQLFPGADGSKGFPAGF